MNQALSVIAEEEEEVTAGGVATPDHCQPTENHGNAAAMMQASSLRPHTQFSEVFRINTPAPASGLA